MSNILRSPIFYMGNKCKLLRQLIPLFPKQCDTFVDLFGGSGVVCMNYRGGQKTIYNEINKNIVELVKMIVNNSPEELNEYWISKIKEYNLPNQSNKRKDLADDTFFVERQKNYNRMRNDYNMQNNRDYRGLYLLSCYSINHLIRFNKNSQFNASSGNASYNEITLQRVENMHNVFKDVEIIEGNAFEFNFDNLTSNSFVYLDPPYSSSEAVYNEKRAFGGWTVESDYKLFELLEKLNQRGIKWGLSNVFENRGKKNTHLVEWCEKCGWKVFHLDRNYNPFSRGNSNNDEVYICNDIVENN